MSAADTDVRAPRRTHVVRSLLLVLVTIATYMIDLGPTGPIGGPLTYGFAFDDVHLIATNQRLDAPGGALDGFTGDYYASSTTDPSGQARALGYYRPIAVLSNWLDTQIWHRDPRGYHATNLLLHVLVVLAFYAFLSTALPDARIAIGAALLFAVHPVHPESVTFISGRVDVLAALFGVAGLWAVARSSRTDGSASRRYTIAALVLMLLALWSKEMAITFPAAIFLCEGLLAPDPVRCWKRAFRRTLPFVGVVTVYLVLRVIVLGRLSSAEGVTDETTALLPRVGTVLATYLGYLVWPPFRFNVEPPVTIASELSALALLGLTVPIALAVVSAIPRMRRREPALAFAILWTLAALVPVSQVLPVETLVGERYLYIPSLGASLAIALVFAWIGRRAGGRVGFAVLVGALTVAYAAGTIVRNPSWRDNLTFWEAKAALDPDSSEAWSALGIERNVTGDIAGAAEAYARALDENPGHLEALNNYALLLLDRGRVDDATRLSMRAVQLSPTYPEALNTLATCFHTMGRYGEAVGQYKRALRMRPDFRQAWVNLGNTYFTAGVPDSALRAYGEAIRLEPDRELHLQYARSLALTRGAEAGIRHLVDAGVCRPGSVDALLLESNLLRMTGHAGEAVTRLERATTLDPTSVVAWVELGQLRATSGDRAAAREAFLRARSLDPSQSVVHNNLGVLAEEDGDPAAAVAHYRDARVHAPQDPEVLRNLGGALVAVSRPAEAIEPLDTSITIFGRDPLARYYRAGAREALGDTAGALTDYEVATTLNPGFADAFHDAGRLFFEMGRADEGRRAFEQFLRTSRPDDPRRPAVEAALAGS